MNILLIKYRNIGDVLLVTPLLANLRHHYPGANIDFALNDYCAAMISDHPDVRQVFSFPRAQLRTMSLHRRIHGEIAYLRQILQNRYDLVINLTEGDRGLLITALSRAGQRLGLPARQGIFKWLNPCTALAGETDLVHTVAKGFRFLDLLGLETVSRKVSIYWSQDIEQRVDLLLRQHGVDRFIHVHPVSRWMFKCWEDDRMAAIIDYLELHAGMRVVITASGEPGERQRVDKILSLCASSPLNLSGRLDLKELACLISRARFFFGIDSAPMHLAAAVDTPVVALFGGSNPVLWGPWDNESSGQVYRLADGIQNVGKHSVIACIDQTIFYENGVKKSRGMTGISEADVLSVVSEKVAQWG